MNKYIIEILKIQSSVILPAFGSLMVANSKTGKVVFNPHLKFNDGALAKFISEKEGIDAQEAQNQVAKFVREIEAELGKGNSYDMFEFGSFKKDSDGTISFDMDPKGAVVTEGTSQKAAPKAATTGTSKKEVKVDEKAVPVTDKKAAKAKAKEDKVADKAKAAEEKAADKAKIEADKIAAKAKIEADKVAAKAKVEADKLKIEADKKAADLAKVTSAKAKETEDLAKATADKVAEEKNKFTPKGKSEEKSESKSEKQSALERAVGDPKKAADIKKPEIVSGTKKENPQEKNEFKPSDEKKEIGGSKAAAAALAAAGKSASATDKKAATTLESSPAEKAAEKAKDPEDKSLSSLKDKYKKSNKPAAKAEKPSKKGSTPKEKGEKKKRKKWPIVLLLLLIGGGVAGFFYKDQIMHLINGDGTEVAESGDEHGDGNGEGNGDGHGEGNADGHGDGTEGENADSNEGHSGEGAGSEMTDSGFEDGSEEIIDETADNNETEEIIEEVVEETPVVNNTSSGGSFHVIGNAFSDKGNADAYVASMKSKGYNSAKVLGQFDNLYMVSIQQHSSRSAASSGASSAGGDAWVFKWPK